MNSMSSIRRACTAALCAALCVILPQAFHAFGLGSMFSPIHIPVLLCGLTCGGTYGLLCGILGPLLSSLITGMPPAAMLVSMVPELAVYGLVSGLAMSKIRTGKYIADLYACLIPAMILGRIVAGIVNTFFYTGGAYTIELFISSYVVGALPGIIVHLLVVPALMMALTAARLTPNPYRIHS